MKPIKKLLLEQILSIGLALTLSVWLLNIVFGWSIAHQLMAWSVLLTGGGLALLLRRWHLSPSKKADQTPSASALRLLKTLALQNAIFHSVNVCSIATDAQGIIQIFNAGAEHMLGYSAIDVIGKMTPAGLADAQETLERAAQLSREMQTPVAAGFETLVYKASRAIEDIYELTYIRKNGSRLPVVVSVTALRDANLKIIGYLLISNDNTTRKHADQEQAMLEQRWRDQQFYTRSLIESNTDALIATNPRGIISDVNRQMEALTGCTRHELIGAPFRNFFTDQVSAESAIARVLREGKVTDLELTARAKDGRETLVSYNATTFHDRDRKLQGVFAAARDITERKRFELTLEQNNIELKSAKAQAEKANLAKSEFLSRMSHELRTPLNAVLGFGQLMASSQPPPSPQQKIAIEQILQAGWYLLHLINEVLDLATIEAGRLSMTQEPMSLSAVLQDCQAMITLQAQKRGIQMHFPDFDQLFYVHADRIRVKQMMINLLSNAIKYNVDGGSVWVTCERYGEQQVRVSVADSGRGMTGEQIAHLFQPFNRLGQESSCEEGTGIGLVVTKQLVELMGGEMGVSSEVGVGSVFWVALTAAPTLIHTQPNVSPSSHHQGVSQSAQSNCEGSGQPDDSQIGTGNETIFETNTGTSIGTKSETKIGAKIGKHRQPDINIPAHSVLYVEDNAANLALVEQLIARRDDLLLHSAANGNDGLRLARSLLPDLIVMDMNLPGISGLAALNLLRDDPTTTHIPVLALSANALAHDIEKGLRAGFFRYLTKPIRVDEFMLALEQTLAHINRNKIAALNAATQAAPIRPSALGAHTDA